jgi:hypothetical protein
MKLYHFSDPGESGYEIVVMANGLAEARALAVRAAEENISDEDMPAVTRDLMNGNYEMYADAVAVVIFTQRDPIQARVAVERLRALEDAEVELKELKAQVGLVG